jgi:nucleoside-diphosphate-sugar epimerase
MTLSRMGVSMPVLVTGASGFVGAHVVLELLKRGIPVRAMMRDISLSQMFPESEFLEVVKADLFDVESLRAAVDGCDDVIHCAAALYVGVKNAEEDVVNPSVKGVENLCLVMGDVKRIVHTSSVAAIRSTKYENGHIFNNEDWCNDASVSSNPYGFAKAEAERRIRAWAENRDVRLVTIHPSIVFGPILHKRHMEGSMSFLKHFVKGPPFVLDMHVNFVDVRDVAYAHVNALEMGIDRSRYIIHKEGMWLNEIGRALSGAMTQKFATRCLPRYLAYIMAIFHPKLSIKRLRGALGMHIGYEVGDSFSALSLPNYDTTDTLVDSVKSLQAQD